MTTAPSTATVAMSQDNSQETYYNSLPSHNVAALWTQLDKMVPPQPNPKASVASWRYKNIQPPLLEAGDIIGAEEAERRVLMLVNPSLEAPYTTDSIYAGLQLILPGEVAPAHRHVAFALRFIIEGTDGFTAVEGEKITMARGDVILTPSWHWHDHGNEGTKPMIWLDGLDLPLYRYLPVNFAEPYASKRYPSTPALSSKFRFPWAPVQQTLDGAASAGKDHVLYHYRHADGSALSKTLGAQAERLSAGATSPAARATTSFVYHIYSGIGHSDITLPDGKTVQRVEWTARDTFAVPAWCSVQHTCTTREEEAAYLFAINDRPMVESLGLFRTSG